MKVTSPRSMPHCPGAFLSLRLWADASASPLPSSPQPWLEGDRNTVCFLRNCWASLTLLFERTPRPGAGQTQGRKNSPSPHVYIDSKWGFEDTGVHRHQFFQEPMDMPENTEQPAPQPACALCLFSKVGGGRPIRQGEHSGETRSGSHFIRRH